MVHAAGAGRVGRVRAVAVAPGEAPAQQADQHAQQRQYRAEQGAIDQQRRPGGLRHHLAQRIEPVQPGAQQVPGPLVRAGIAHHQPAVAGHVQQVPFSIVGLDPIQRSLAGQRMIARPGIFFDLIEQAHFSPLGELPRAGQGLGRADARDTLAAACVYRQQRPVAIVQQVARRAAGTGQAQAERGTRIATGSKRRTRRDAAARIQRCQSRQMLGRRQLGIADEEHHHAADDPGQDEQPQGDAQPAMREVQIALHAAQKSRVTAAYSARPSPGACKVSAPSYQTYS